MVKLRMTMPKKEEDIEKVMEEVMESHPDMMEDHHHHHHHHHHHDDELIIVLNSIVDGMNHFNTHLKSLDERVAQLEKGLTFMARINAIVYKALLQDSPSAKRKALEELEKLLDEFSKKPSSA